MYPLLRPIFNKGGAGRSMTREESVEAISPLVREHQKLLHAYDAALRTLGDRDLAATINSGMNRARAEHAKLRETIYSLGGDTSNGVDLDPNMDLGASDAAIVHALDERERAYRDALQRTLKMPHHQMRSIAILENNVAGSNARIETLHPFVTRMRKPERRAEGRPVEPVPTDDTATPVDLAPDEQHAREQPVIDIPDRR
jgi:hypothetical protein